LKNGVNKTISAFASIMLLILLIFTAIHFLGLNKGLYGVLQRKFDVADEIGISQNDLDSVTEVFIDYTKVNRDNLDVAVSLDGQQVEMFNEREKLHMIDVKALYDKMIKICFVLAALTALILIYLLIRKQKETIYRMHKKVSIGFLFFCAALGVYFVIDFNSFWTNIHLLLFTNDLWLLNPMTDRMIIMFPLNFFLALSVIVLTVFIVIFALLFIWSNKGLKRIEKRESA
jgi:integral membrane protein (TIGR01906 family)